MDLRNKWEMKVNRTLQAKWGNIILVFSWPAPRQKCSWATWCLQQGMLSRPVKASANGKGGTGKEEKLQPQMYRSDFIGFPCWSLAPLSDVLKLLLLQPVLDFIFNTSARHLALVKGHPLCNSANSTVQNLPLRQFYMNPCQIPFSYNPQITLKVPTAMSPNSTIVTDRQ